MRNWIPPLAVKNPADSSHLFLLLLLLKTDIRLLRLDSYGTQTQQGGGAKMRPEAMLKLSAVCIPPNLVFR